MGTNKALDKLYNECNMCNAMKKLPKQEIFNSTTIAKKPGTHFVCDILRRAKQKIMVVRDQFSSYTMAQFVRTENHNDLMQAIVNLVTPIRDPNHVIIRTDQATGMKKIADDNLLKDLDMEIEVGNDFNKNSNAVVDKAIQELEREITILHPGEFPINITILAKAVLNLNDRLRRNGNLSARNILFSRDEKLNKNLFLQDERLAQEQKITRDEANLKKSHQISTKEMIDTGDAVMLRQNPKKHLIRDTFIVTSKEKGNLNMKKLTNLQNQHKKTQIRNKTYTVHEHKVFKVQKPISREKNSDITKLVQKNKPFDPIRRYHSSDDESSSDDEIESNNEAAHVEVNEDNDYDDHDARDDNTGDEHDNDEHLDDNIGNDIEILKAFLMMIMI